MKCGCILSPQDLVLSGYEVPAGTHLDLNPSVHFRLQHLHYHQNRNHHDHRVHTNIIQVSLQGPQPLP